MLPCYARVGSITRQLLGSAKPALHEHAAEKQAAPLALSAALHIIVKCNIAQWLAEVAISWKQLSQQHSRQQLQVTVT